jgi:hypothetical protein
LLQGIISYQLSLSHKKCKNAVVVMSISLVGYRPSGDAIVPLTNVPVVSIYSNLTTPATFLQGFGDGNRSWRIEESVAILWG